VEVIKCKNMILQDFLVLLVLSVLCKVEGSYNELKENGRTYYVKVNT
jgi:hypothetical protein